MKATVRIKAAWWVRWYISGVYLCAVLLNMQPDWQKVERTIKRGVRLSLE